MKGKKVEYQHRDQVFEAQVFFPARAEASSFLVFVFHTWRGRDAFACAQAERLATLGYSGVALDLYGQGVLGTSVEESSALMQPLVDDRSLLQARMLVSIDAVRNALGASDHPYAAIGFCFGGLCVLDLARSGAFVQGVVSFHGLLHPPKKTSGSQVKAKILVLHGRDDPMVDRKEVVAFEREMTDLKADWQLHTYGNTLHGFTDPAADDLKLGVMYNPLSARRAYETMASFLREVFARFQ